MDFTEVNFLQSEEEEAEADMLTVRLLIEKIVQTVHHQQHLKKQDELQRNKLRYQFNHFNHH
jgi:hypothetical protein